MRDARSLVHLQLRLHWNFLRQAYRRRPFETIVVLMLATIALVCGSAAQHLMFSQVGSANTSVSQRADLGLMLAISLTACGGVLALIVRSIHGPADPLETLLRSAAVPWFRLRVSQVTADLVVVLLLTMLLVSPLLGVFVQLEMDDSSALRLGYAISLVVWGFAIPTAADASVVAVSIGLLGTSRARLIGQLAGALIFVVCLVSTSVSGGVAVLTPGLGQSGGITALAPVAALAGGVLLLLIGCSVSRPAGLSFAVRTRRGRAWGVSARRIPGPGFVEPLLIARDSPTLVSAGSLAIIAFVVGMSNREMAASLAVPTVLAVSVMMCATFGRVAPWAWCYQVVPCDRGRWLLPRVLWNIGATILLAGGSALALVTRSGSTDDLAALGTLVVMIPIAGLLSGSVVPARSDQGASWLASTAVLVGASMTIIWLGDRLHNWEGTIGPLMFGIAMTTTLILLTYRTLRRAGATTA